MADKWLREHDPYYKDMSRGKLKKISHPYYTPDQELSRRRREIPISSLNHLSSEQETECGNEMVLDFLSIDNCLIGS